MSHHTNHQNQAMQQCIDNCLNCHRICLQTVTHCLSIGGPHAAPAHIGLLLDCAEICQTSANFMLRNSYFHAHTCGVCAEICEDCAEDCEGFGADQAMQECARQCRRCAESCQEMAGMAMPV